MMRTMMMTRELRGLKILMVLMTILRKMMMKTTKSCRYVSTVAADSATKACE